MDQPDHLLKPVARTQGRKALIIGGGIGGSATGIAARNYLVKHLLARVQYQQFAPIVGYDL